MSNIITEDCLTDHLLIAMPSLQDPVFSKTVALLCEHGKDGTIGLTINRPVNVNIKNIFEQMKITFDANKIQTIPVLQGGPIQPDRGFVIHHSKGNWTSTLNTNNQFFVTTSRDILEAMAIGQGPRDSIISLGYSGWGPEQLVQEIIENSWISCPATNELVFDVPVAKKWLAALQSLGINPHNITDESGNA